MGIAEDEVLFSPHGDFASSREESGRSLRLEERNSGRGEARAGIEVEGWADRVKGFREIG